MPRRGYLFFTWDETNVFAFSHVSRCVPISFVVYRRDDCRFRGIFVKYERNMVYCGSSFLDVFVKARVPAKEVSNHCDAVVPTVDCLLVRCVNGFVIRRVGGPLRLHSVLQAGTICFMRCRFAPSLYDALHRHFIKVMAYASCRWCLFQCRSFGGVTTYFFRVEVSPSHFWGFGREFCLLFLQ